MAKPAKIKLKAPHNRKPRKSSEAHSHPYIDPAMEIVAIRVKRAHSKMMAELVDEIEAILEEK